MKEELPPLDPVVERLAEDLMKVPAVKEGIAIALREADDAMKEEVEITEVPSTTFHEEVRAKEIARRMRLYGLTDVTIDEIGNVVGKRPGKGGGPVLALGAHMDTAFAEGTPVKVRREGNRYFGPGIGDNGSGLRALLQTIRCMNEAGIETEGDVWFVGTVGEEGNGDIRGSKYLFRDGLRSPIDGFIAVDNTDVGRILSGAIGAHRWRYTIEGPGGHSYASFGKVPSAIHAMCLAGARVAKLRVPDDPKTTFTIGTVRGGSTVNSIAASCTADVDMRSLGNSELLKLEAAMHAAFEEGVEEENRIWGVAGTGAALTLEKTPIGNRPGGMRPGDCPVLQAARAAQKALGIPMTKYTCSSTDANMPVSLGIPATCLSAGGVQMKTHTLDEYFDCVDIHLGPQLILLTVLILAGTAGRKPLLPKRNP